MFLRTRVYPITDVRASGLSHAEQVVRLSDGGAKLIQLREKGGLTPREFFKQAEEASQIARHRGIKIVINDRVDIALALEAGVHLGQDDLPPEAARRVLGDGAIIGLSTHNVEQARVATQLPVNYLAIGPIFDTFSKIDSEPVVGLDGLRRVREAIGDFPLVAIGGINEECALEVLKAGADAIAVIGALLANPKEISERTKKFLASTAPFSV